MTVHASAKSRPLVLHVSGDFPDSVVPFKTPVIRAFLELTAPKFDHSVVSLNRVSPALSALPGLAFSRTVAPPYFKAEPFTFGTAVQYAAPARGILHKTRLDLLGDWLAAHIAKMDRRPDMLMAHKLTIEGIAVQRAARQLGLPYALTIQGNTDRRIMRMRPDLVNAFRSIYLGASKVMTFTPIAKRAIESKLGHRPDGIALIPCPTELDTVTSPRLSGNGLITVFHLKNHKVKNLKGMAEALSLATPGQPSPKLSVIGGGTEKELLRCQAVAASSPSIVFEGALDRAAINGRMNSATALVQPSLSESFGLVFVEALFAGLPIIYPSGTGIDGYFDGAEFALRADPKSPMSILTAMQKALTFEQRMKEALAQWQLSQEAGRFTRPAIAAAFTDLLSAAITSSHKQGEQ